ncbi:serine/threonine protein kinase [bacterium]|nr:serine/threonine protein kinase [bacterium]MCI0602614.1 serine/threonine protein kinase [bacterium]
MSDTNFELPVTNWDRYQIESLLGEGGMAKVYKAYDPQLKRYVALKFIRNDDQIYRERLLKEARAQAQIDHDHICRIYEVGQVDNKQYIAMQYIKGQTLNEIQSEMSLQQKVIVMQKVASAVDAAHRLGIIHRDLKPSNIMIERCEDGTFRPYVLDFGIARVLNDPALTSTDQIVGTPSFMSPEQLFGGKNLDHRTDIYSLGALFYSLLTGKAPFDGSSAEILVKILKDDPPAIRKMNRSIPKDIETIVMKCLEKDPQRRYQTAKDLAEDLARYLSGDPILARKPNWSYQLRKQMNQHKVIAALLIGMLLSGGIFSALNIVIPTKTTASIHVEKPKIFLSVFSFENETDRTELNFATRGLSVELSRILAQENFIVVPFSDVQDSLSKGLAPVEAARKAGASYFVKGALRNGAAGVELKYSLVQVGSKKELSDSFPLSSADFLGALNQVKTQLLSWLQQKPMQSPVSMNAQAFELYLRGVSKISEMEEGETNAFGQASALLQQALHTSPSVKIYHGLAYLHYQAVNLGIDFHPANLELCRYYLDRGLALRSDYGPLIDIKTRYEFYMGRPAMTLRIAADQIKADRFNLEQIGMIGMALRQSGNFELSERFFQYALKLSPENYYMKLIYNASLFQAGKHRESLDGLATLYSDYPQKYWGKFYLAWYDLLLGKTDEGTMLILQLPDTLPTRILRYQAEAVTGKTVPFQPDHRMLEAAKVDLHVSFRLAQCYSLSGDLEKASIYLKNTVQKGWIAWNYFDWDPMLAHLRTSESYQKMRAEGLPVQQSTIELEKKLLQPVLEKLGIQ